jgi:DNA-binding MarR family transcriptional regulator
MNLIELFEKRPFQDVGTFNAIFKTTPLLGFPATMEVEIKELVREKRRIVVGETELLLDLTQKKLPSKAMLEQKGLSKKAKKLLAIKKEAKLPDIYKTLKPSEFMIYSAVSELGSVDGITELAKHLSIDQRSIRNNLTRLEKLGLIKTTSVACRSGEFLRLSVDTTSN